MTNDGNLARYLELPNYWSRKYRVRVHGSVDDRDLSELSKGITIDGIRYDKVFAKLDRQMKSNAWITISIRKVNREVRRILRHIVMMLTV